MDGGDLLALCDENLVYRYDLWDGIRRGLLAPFHYFGVPDAVDYRNIPWRSTRFDEEALTRALATQAPKLCPPCAQAFMVRMQALKSGAGGGRSASSC